ncbi:GNAT family N-acetyltransferase [Actinoplanes sp. NPDC051494]|uniref:GNAT family N-acetyltransferase n=1 Tax=Actinoplanes sp. NPDC051494 TaxID=3363907 RepID=UPI003789A33D
MVISIRLATRADAGELHDLAARTFGLAAPADTPQPDIDAFIATNLSVASFERYLADPSRVLLIADRDDKPIGYAMLAGGPVADPHVAALVSAVHAGPSIELSKFYLTQDTHGSGAAAALMTATLEAAVRAGAAFCWLGVNEQNARAARFYAKHGFEVIGVKRFQVGDTWFDDPVRGRVLS